MRRHSNGGFTLTELLMVGVLLAILAAMAMPQYDRAIEQQRRRAAADVLRAIYAGERTYWMHANAYRVVAATDAAGFQAIYTPLPTIDGVSFSVLTNGAAGAAATFTATATRQASGRPCNGQQLQINQDWDPQTDPPTNPSNPWPANGSCP